MVFDFDQYCRNDMFFPIVILLFLLPGWFSALARVISQIRSREWTREELAKNLFALAVASFLCGINLRVLLGGGMYLVFERPGDAVTLCGTVERIEDYGSMGGHKYDTEDFGTELGARITVEGVEYHAMTAGNLEVGDEVRFTYLPRSGYILEIREIQP